MSIEIIHKIRAKKYFKDITRNRPFEYRNSGLSCIGYKLDDSKLVTISPSGFKVLSFTCMDSFCDFSYVNIKISAEEVQ